MAKMSQHRIFSHLAFRWPQIELKFVRIVDESVMPGYTEKSRRYLRLADEQTHRAEAALSPKSKAMYLQLASQYRDLAQQIDDPARWRARRMIAKVQKHQHR